MNPNQLKTRLALGLVVSLLAACAPDAPSVEESATTMEDAEALAQDSTQAEDGELLEDADEDGPFPAAGDESAPEDHALELESTELDGALDMVEEDWAFDDRDEFNRLQMISIASEPLLQLGDVDVAEDAVGKTAMGGLDTGSGPTIGRDKAPWAEGRIIRIAADGSVVGWVCDTRTAKQPMVALLSLRDENGIRAHAAISADATPVADWTTDWIKSRCKGEKAHFFSAKFDEHIQGNDKVVLKLVGHDGERVLLEKRVYRHAPIGAVTRFRTGDHSMKKIAGWACDMDTPDARVTVEIVSNRGLERKHATDVAHGRKVHLKCSGGTKHRFEFDLDRKVPCGKDEVFRVFAYNTGNVGKDRVLLGKRTVHGGSCVDPTPDSVKELAQALLKSPNVTFPYTNDARVVLQELAAGHQAPVSCSNNATGTGSRTTVSLDMMKFLYDLSKKGLVPINAITDRCHSAYSNHYRGHAVDFACNVNISLANAVAAQHGGAHNFENCASNAHWHFDF